MSTFNTANLIGEFWIGDVQAVVPADMSGFKHQLTDEENATKSVAGSNSINSTDEDIYGAQNSIEILISNKRSYDVTVLVKVDSAPDSLYTQIRNAFYNPLDAATKVSFLARTKDPVTGLPVGQDYFCPEANMMVDADPGFGDAGALMEVTITFSEVTAGDLVDVIPAEGGTIIALAPVVTTSVDSLVYDVAVAKTFSDVLIDLGATAMSGDGVTPITAIKVADKDGVEQLVTASVPAVAGIYSYLIKVEEGTGVNKKSDMKAISILVNTGAVAPTLAARSAKK